MEFHQALKMERINYINKIAKTEIDSLRFEIHENITFTLCFEYEKIQESRGKKLGLHVGRPI